MIEQDKEEFAEAVTEVLKSYRQEVGKITLRIWWAALEKHDLNIVLNALGAYCASPDKCKFAPKAGDIVGMIEGTATDRQALAGAAFAKVIANSNPYNTVVFDDPAIHYAINVAYHGRWENVSKFDPSEYESQANQRAFEKAYVSYKEGMSYPARLTGIHEQENALNGYEYGDVEYIGDNKLCLEVESKAIESGMKKIELKD